MRRLLKFFGYPQPNLNTYNNWIKREFFEDKKFKIKFNNFF